MAGLLDFDMQNPEAQGFNNALMQAAAMLLTPRGRGGGIGSAFAAFPQAIERGKEQAMRGRMMGLQEQQMGMQGQKFGLEMDEYRRKLAQDAQQKQLISQFVQTLPPEQQQAAMLAPQEFIKTMLPQAPKLETIYGPDGQPQKAWMRGPGVDPIPVGGSQKPAMPWEFELGPDGQPRMRPSVLSAKTQVASAGKPTVDVKVNTKMGESIGAQVGPMLKASRDKTEGALKLGATGQQIIQAIDSGKVIAGPGASWRMLGAQLVDVFGVGGKDNNERILNTRRVIRGLAESAVEARKELAGQGQVTENEAKAVEKAMSGNIDDLTVDEIKLIAGLNVKAARWRASQHQQMIGNMPEEMRAAAPFYAIPGMDQWLQAPPEQSAPAASVGGAQAAPRLRFNPQTGRLE